MALHNLKIVVVDGGKEGSYKSKNATEKSNDETKQDIKKSPLYKMLHWKDNLRNEIKTTTSPATVFALDMGVKVASQLVKQTANYFISDIGRQNGDSNYQDMINRQIEVYTEPLNIVGGALSGAMAGSMFGPIGIGIGALVGTVSSSISLGFKYAERDRAYQFEMFKQNNAQTYNMARANYNALAGRVR